MTSREPRLPPASSIRLDCIEASITFDERAHERTDSPRLSRRLEQHAAPLVSRQTRIFSPRAEASRNASMRVLSVST